MKNFFRSLRLFALVTFTASAQTQIVCCSAPDAPGFTSQSANQVFASPDGEDGLPIFRQLTAADLDEPLFTQADADLLYHPLAAPYLPLTGGTLTGSLTGTAAFFPSKSVIGGTAVVTNSSILDVLGPSTFASRIYTTNFMDTTTAFAAGVGGSIGLGGRYNTAGNVTQYGVIAGIKANATEADFAGALEFYTKTAGVSVPPLQLRMVTGAATFIGSVAIGSGTPILKHLSSTASLDYATASANTCQALTVTLTGAADGNVTSVGVLNALAAHNTTATFFAWVSATNTVSVRRCVITADGGDPAAATVRVAVMQH